MSNQLRQTIILGILLLIFAVLIFPIVRNYIVPEKVKKIDQVLVDTMAAKNKGKISEHKKKTNALQQQSGIVAESATEFIKRMEAVEIQHDRYEDVVDNLFTKIQNQQYLDVENFFDDLIETKEKGKDGKHLIYYIYNALTSNYLDSGFEVIDKWCNNSKHHSSFMIRAGYYINDGWKDRGHGYANSVSPEQFNLFHKKLSLAHEDLIKAYELCQTNPIIPMAMIQVIRGNGLGRQQLNKWYELGVNIDPTFYWIYKQYFTSILPKWGGMPGESQAFLKKINTNPPPGSLVYTLWYYQFSDQIRKKGYRLNISEYDQYFNELEEVVGRYGAEVPNSNKYKIKLLELKGWCNIHLDLNEAEKNFKSALALNSSNDVAWYGLGDVFSRKVKMQKDAMLFYNKAIELNPSEGWYYPNRANVSSNLRLFDQCIADYSFAIDNGYSRTSNYYHRRGWCYKSRAKGKSDKKDIQMALDDFSRAIKLKPNAYTYSSRGGIYKELEKYQDAIQDYSKAIELKSDQYFFYNNRAKIYIEVGNYAKAVADAKQVLSMKPNDSTAKSIIANYQNRVDI